MTPDLVASEPLFIRKVPPIDCRVVRGFLATSVDGTVFSRDYRGTVREYPKTASDGVAYAFNNNDGLHITLADADGFDLVVLRGGGKARMFADPNSLTEPWGVVAAEFTGAGPIEIARLARVKHQKVSLFSITGTIGDISFYRIDTAPPIVADSTWSPAGETTLPEPKSQFAPESLTLAMKERYGEQDRRALSLIQQKGQPIQFAANRHLHFLTAPLPDDKGLASITLDATVTQVTAPTTLTAIVQDPLDPRLDLFCVPIKINEAGRIRLYLDIPDQVLLNQPRLWITLCFDKAVTLTGPDGGGGPQFHLHMVPREKALPQAMAHRKFLMRSFFMLLSEPRPWGAYRKQSRDEFYASSQYAKQCPELFMTIDLCHQLDPKDDLVRQYREWVYVSNLDQLSQIPPPPPPPDGVPAWAWYPRMAWLETRRIAQWWIDNRMVPTGEFGGRVGDDSDMYQQYLDLPFFEDTGTGAQLKEHAARMAELAEKQNLRGGLNVHSTDALHAYEEGINHLALMSRWFYGDPIYFERCMESARNMESLTIVTADGRRHFRDKENMGARDMEKPRPPAQDGDATPLMWHTALQVADYNRNPKALKLVCEWADTWLRFQRPGQYATNIEVTSGKVLDFQKDRPLYGGYRTQAVVFTWLAALTSEARYIEPFMHSVRQGRSAAGDFLPDLYNARLLDTLDRSVIDRQASQHPVMSLYLKNDSQPLVQTTIGNPRSSFASIEDVYDARRWPDMFTTAEQFTDRVFPNILQHGSSAYLGGFTRRNKFNTTRAVSWEGFKTDYAALVVANRPDRLKVLVYSFAEAPMAGVMRLWGLEHGRYEVSISNDKTPSTPAIRELVKADTVSLTLPPRQVTTIELRQTEKLPSIFTRADLAIASRELELKGTTLAGTIHNIGSADAPDVTIAILDETGRTVLRRSLGQLAAPADLLPKRLPFTLNLPQPPRNGWKLVIDPDNQLSEIYEGNNSAAIPVSGI